MCNEARKEKLLQYICDYLRRNGYPPTFREMKDVIGVKSISTVSACIDALVRDGRLEKGEGRQSRSLRPVGTDFVPPDTDLSYSRVRVRTADGGYLFIDCGVRPGEDGSCECVFSGVLDCSGLKSAVSRVVDFDTV